MGDDAGDEPAAGSGAAQPSPGVQAAGHAGPAASLTAARGSLNWAHSQ